MNARRAIVLSTLLAACTDDAGTTCPDGGCAVVCSAEAPCPLGQMCVEQRCVARELECRTDDDCADGRCVDGECFADLCTEGETRDCSNACGEGTERCRQGVWRSCTAREPLVGEVCGDPRDDDCDGVLDEGCEGCDEGATRPCENECGAGVETCVAEVWEGCDAPRPGVESCEEGGDEDCDGEVDEGCAACTPDETRPCVTDCGEGTERCVDGAFAECDAPAPDAEGRCEEPEPECTLADRKPSGDVRLSDPGGRAWFPELFWTGVEYGVFFGDRRRDQPSAVLARVSPMARALGAQAVLERNLGAAAFLGDGYRALGVTTGRLYLANVSSFGRRLSETDALDLTTSGLDSQMVARDGELGVVWSEGLEQLHFARLSADGATRAGPVQLTNTPGRSGNASLVADAGGFAIAFRDERDAPDDPFDGRIYFLRLRPDGRKVAPERAVADGREVALAALGDGYAIAYADARDGPDTIYFRRLDADGAPVGAEIQISDSPNNARDPALAVTDDGFGVVWSDRRYQEGPELHFARLDARGAVLERFRLTEAAGDSQHPAVLWRDGRFAVTWSDTRESGPDGADVYFAEGPMSCAGGR